MNEDVVADLKQFIVAQLNQQLSNVATKDDLAKLEKRFDGLEHTVNEMKEFLENSTIGYIETIDKQVQRHEKRITKLERKAA